MKTYGFSSRLVPTSKSSRRAIARTPSYTLGLWGQIWQKVVAALMGNSEPRVWTELDKQGKTYWRAHDPVNNSYFSGSEIDMRRWIEQRYYA